MLPLPAWPFWFPPMSKAKRSNPKRSFKKIPTDYPEKLLINQCTLDVKIGFAFFSPNTSCDSICGLTFCFIR